MSYGLQLYSETGDLTLSVTDRLTRVFGLSTLVLQPSSFMLALRPAVATNDFTVRVVGLANVSQPIQALVEHSQVPEGVFVYNRRDDRTVTITVLWLGY